MGQESLNLLGDDLGQESEPRAVPSVPVRGRPSVDGVITGTAPRRRAVLTLPLLALTGGVARCAAPSVAPPADPVNAGIPTVGPATPQPSSSQLPYVVRPAAADPVVWSVASTVGIVVGRGPAGAVDVLAGFAAPRFTTREEAQAWAAEAAGRTWGMAGRVGPDTFLWEPNHGAAVTPAAAARLSRPGTFAGLTWTAEQDITFVYARQGKVVRLLSTSDPLVVIGEPLPQERLVDLRSEHPVAAGLLLLSRVTGTPAPEPAWLLRPDVRLFGRRY